MASIYPRGGILWCKVKECGAWVPMSTGFRVGDEARARRFALRAQKAIDDASGTAGTATGPCATA